MGVGSNRVDVHRACVWAEAQRSLEKRAEPMSALFLPVHEYPHALADIAWRKLILNSAHDCSAVRSVDEVVDQVLVRYYEARQIGDGLTHDAMRALATQVAAPVARPWSRTQLRGRARGSWTRVFPAVGLCHFVGPDGVADAAQVIGEGGGDGFQTMVTGQKVRWVLDLMRASEFAGRQIHAYEVTPVPSTTDQHDILLIEARWVATRGSI